MSLRCRLAVVLTVVTVFMQVNAGDENNAGASVKRGDAAAYVKVVDVAADDALNMRAAPDGHAAVEARIPPDSKVLRLGERGDWIRVVYRGGAGWVYGKYVIASKAPDFAEAGLEGLVCTGTEPHWMLKTKGDRLVYGMYGEQRGYQLDTAIAPAIGRRGLWQATAYSAGDDEEPAAGLSMIIQSDKRCSDSMSDRTYEYSIFLTNKDQDLLAGCCRVPD